jgi:hypothetical protein
MFLVNFAPLCRQNLSKVAKTRAEYTTLGDSVCVYVCNTLLLAKRPNLKLKIGQKTTLRFSSISFHTLSPGNTKGGSITVPLTSCLTGLESAV